MISGGTIFATRLLRGGSKEGATSTAWAGCSLSFSTQAQMILQVLDQLAVVEFDLVANDSGGAIAQLIAVAAPERVSSMVLTNCDLHDNWPPPAFMPAATLTRHGRLATAMAEMVGNLGLARSDLGLRATFENPEHLTKELVRAYIGPRSRPACGRSAFGRRRQSACALPMKRRPSATGGQAPSAARRGRRNSRIDILE